MSTRLPRGARRERARNLRGNGCTVRRIGQLMGVSTKLVETWLRRKSYGGNAAWEALGS